MAGLQKNILEDLNTRIQGSVLTESDPAYTDARQLWNAMIDRRPAAIVQALGVQDVIEAVNFARDNQLLLSVKGGGHNISGLAVCDDGLMLDMSRMRGVWVDPDSRTAHAQAGCILGDVDRETQIHGLAAVLGFVSKTGIAGLTLGGGFGYLTRRFGWTSDNVRSIEMVTSEGRVVRASEKQNTDLFWGLRGGGGNFGVVTGFEYKLYPVGPEIVAGAIAWRAEDARKVLEMYHMLVEQAPPELTCAAALRFAPPAPWLPADVHGKPVIVLFVCHSGPIEEAEKQVASIKGFGSPVGDVVQRRPYAVQQSLIDATQPKGRRYYWKSEYLPKLSPELLAKYVDNAGKMVSPHSVLFLLPIDGALNHLPVDHSPVGNRDAAMIINIAASWENESDDQANIAWARNTWEDVREFSTGGTYINFLTEEEGDNRIQAAYGSNYDRLVEIKSKWDPKNLFRVNKNIAPQK